MIQPWDADGGVSSWITANRERLLAELLDYLRQPSVSATGEGFPEATSRTAAEMRLSGLDTQVIDTPGRPAVVGHRVGPAGAPTVLIYGHYDVQPPGPRELWRTEPFDPVIREGRIWGRGTGDNKGQHFAHLQALRLLLADGGYPCSVTVVLDGEEELGSPNLADVVAGHRAELAADVVIYSDGPVHESGRWCVKHGVRGLLAIRLTAEGANRPLHSGNFGNVAPNPAWTVVHALASLHDANGRVAVEGFYDNVQPLPAADRAALAALPGDPAATLTGLGLDRMDPTLAGMTFYERLAALPTLTINGIETGDVTRTIIPHTATARIDIRLVAGQQPDRVLARVQEHLHRYASDVELAVEAAVPPARTPLDNPYTPCVAAAIEKATGAPPLLIPALGGTLPTYVWTDLLGAPTLGIPLANVDESNHGPNENIEVDRYLTGIAMSAAVLRGLGRGCSVGRND